MELREFFKNHPFIKIIIPLCIGILLQTSFNFSFSIYTGLFTIIALFTGALLVIKPKSIFTEWKAGLIIFLLIGVVGIFITAINIRKTESFKISSKDCVHLVLVKSNPEIKEKSVKITCLYLGDSLSQTNSNPGLCIINFRKDSLSQNLNPGDILLVRTKFEEIQGPKNPEEFNYKDFLFRKGIVYQAFAESDSWLIIDNKSGLNENILGFRQSLIKIFEENGLSGANLSIASALVLGDKTLLEKDLKLSFSHAGAIHVLAVSGLHVGIIYLVINSLLSFLNRPKNGKYFKAIIIILFLWFYALLTGMSPSVLRSATMFSFVTVGNSLTRKVSVYNSLSASAFLLLCFNPQLLMDVGFQLSYLAVFSIVFFQSKFYALVFFKNKYVDKLWALTTVSLAAQLGTTPISLYYFNQFPNLFFLTNLLVIPLAAVILYLAFLLFVFSFVPFVNEALGWLLSISAQLMIKAVEIVEAIPFSYSGGIYFSLIQTFCFYGLIIVITTYALLKKRWMIFASLVFAIFFFADMSLRKVNLENNHSFTVYAIRGTSLINFTDGRKAIFFADSLNFPLEKYDFQISKHRLVSGIKDFKIHSYNDSLERINDNLKKIENFFVWNNTLIYRLGNGTILPKNLTKPIKTDFILVSGNVYLPPEKIDSIFHFKKIILDSSVKTYLAEKWLNNPLYANRVHYVERDGAFVFVN